MKFFLFILDFYLASMKIEESGDDDSELKSVSIKRFHYLKIMPFKKLLINPKVIMINARKGQLRRKVISRCRQSSAGL